MTSIQQRDAQTVLAAIDDLLPRLRERNQETEDLRRIPDATIADLDEAGYFKMLQPEQWGGLSHAVLRGGSPDRQCLWLDRMGHFDPGSA